MSTTHTVHEDVHESGLADDCDRCGEHAQRPLVSLDDTTLRDLLQRVVNGTQPRSQNESVAMAQVRGVLNEAAVLAELNPVLFAKYMKSRDVHLIAVVRP